jgi:large subunit ribosomal protein L27Ae
MDKYHPGYFGKVGMRYFHKLQNQFWKPVINLDKVRLNGAEFWGWDTDMGCAQLWSLVPAEQREKFLANKSSDTAPVLDLLSFGYSKVLGKGRLPEVPLIVRARYFSKDAEKKIKEAGGVVQLVA